MAIRFGNNNRLGNVTAGVAQVDARTPNNIASMQSNAYHTLSTPKSFNEVVTVPSTAESETSTNFVSLKDIYFDQKQEFFVESTKSRKAYSFAQMLFWRLQLLHLHPLDEAPAAPSEGFALILRR